SCVRAAIGQMGQMVSTLPADHALESMRRGSSMPSSGGGVPSGGTADFAPFSPGRMADFSLPSEHTQHHLFVTQVREIEAGYSVSGPLNLGTPLAQIHSCYILSQSEDGVILIDQHAAHERITYEKMKAQLENGELARQMMLTPENWEPGLKIAAWLSDHADELNAFGVDLDQSGEESFSIRSVPAQLSGEAPVELIAELVDACMLIGAEAEGRGRVLERWLGNRACKGSIKAGRVLSIEDQDALLREMEKTPNIAQCNHGRPTYVRLSLNDLDRLFGRKE
ncbi:MAG TPA: DNA mismatch repair protein MutL, partial [Mariprofundaceae bacterium]|nr:DNA mismatch repair protein MutL [Mariprofundaceae bacterium]